MRGHFFMALAVFFGMPQIADAEPADYVEHTETVRARFSTATPDADPAPALGKIARLGVLEGNTRFRLHDADNRAALAGDISAYLQTNDNQYQLVPNELYLDAAPAEWVGANAGRRRLVFGSGFAANPMDWLNPAKDALNPLDQRTGAYLGLVEAHTANYALTVIYSPTVTPNDRGIPTGIQLDEYVALARVYALLAEGDLNVQGGLSRNSTRHNIPRVGASYSRYFFDYYEGHFEVSARQGSDTQLVNPLFAKVMRQAQSRQSPSAGGLFAPPTLAPFETPGANSKDWYPKILLGTRYTFESGDMATAEYLFNGEGLNYPQWHDRIQLIRALPPGFLMGSLTSSDPSKKFNFANSRKHYAYLNYTAAKLGTSALMEDLGATAALALNFEREPSALLYPSVSLRRGDHVKLITGLALPIGSPTSEFGAVPFREQYVFEIQTFF